MSKSAEELIKHLNESFRKADNGESSLPPEIYEATQLRGMSTPKVRHLLNNLTSLTEVNYLEIGTWQGSTICAAAYENEGNFYAIDNFVHNFSFDEEQGVSIFELLNRNLSKFGLNDKVKFFKHDCFKFNLDLIPDKINVYFYDGEHSEGSQAMALTYFKPVLDDTFIYVVDDWRDRGDNVESGSMIGTFKGIQQGGFEQIYHVEEVGGQAS